MPDPGGPRGYSSPFQPMGLARPPPEGPGPGGAGPDPVSVPAITRPATAVIAPDAATTKNPRARRGRRRARPGPESAEPDGPVPPMTATTRARAAASRSGPGRGCAAPKALIRIIFRHRVILLVFRSGLRPRLPRAPSAPPWPA